MQQAAPLSLGASAQREAQPAAGTQITPWACKQWGAHWGRKGPSTPPTTPSPAQAQASHPTPTIRPDWHTGSSCAPTGTPQRCQSLTVGGISRVPPSPRMANCPVPASTVTGMPEAARLECPWAPLPLWIPRQRGPSQSATISRPGRPHPQTPPSPGSFPGEHTLQFLSFSPTMEPSI